MKTAEYVSFPPLTLSKKATVSLGMQIYFGIRDKIIRGVLKPGARLPTSRELATSLKVSRGLVIRAYNKLIAEDYLEATVGSGTRVSQHLPDREPISAERNETTNSRLPVKCPTVYGDILSLHEGIRESWTSVKPFRHGVPPLDIFPLDVWSKLTRKVLHRASLQLLRYDHGSGSLSLRNAIATHVAAGRGIACDPAQIYITSGSTQALDLCARLFVRPGDVVYFEEPGYLGAYNILRWAGANLVPTVVDSEGCKVPSKTSRARQQLLFTTPSHQFPLGHIMSLSRRLNLIDWATQKGALLIEDDYSGEYRYRDAPFPALKALDKNAPVIYIGTMSKALFPGLRIGYFIVPPQYENVIERLSSILPASVSSIEQATLNEFICSGQYARHMRRIRKVSNQRRELLEEILNSNLPAGYSISSQDAGMHLIVHLPKKISDAAIAAKLTKLDIQVVPLSECYIGKPTCSGLLLHYAGYTPRQIREAGMRMCDCLSRAGDKL